MQAVGLPFDAGECDVRLAGKSISAMVSETDSGIAVSFSESVSIDAGETLVISML